jgi:hypothetical protein
VYWIKCVSFRLTPSVPPRWIFSAIAQKYTAYTSSLKVTVTQPRSKQKLTFFLSMALEPFGPLPLFQFLNLYTDRRTPWTGDQPIARPLPTHKTTQTQNKRTQTTMHRVGFEPTIPGFEWVKTVHALHRATTVIRENWHGSAIFHKIL